MERKIEAGLKPETLLKRLLLERLSLRAIARILQVSLGWLMPRIQHIWEQEPMI
ncbi:hypothetical protein [Adhaeribacter radiodurans]|uniref:Helix-turn-helix domain-containing protein n=1 Tax=Adhaeribacter radiodurans TaxID=2745197 RepID=A0A7L7L4X9_9BACT|nr:hypothetical protein [Adhaeribacter radiodurans]QMU27439.1 hypothetical protein HUW48_05025 [Adhaeribacter radiodurans]